MINITVTILGLYDSAIIPTIIVIKNLNKYSKYNAAILQTLKNSNIIFKKKIHRPN